MDGSEVITSLKELAIAIRVLKRYPEALQEFKKEVNRSPDQTPEVTPVVSDYDRNFKVTRYR